MYFYITIYVCLPHFYDLSAFGWLLVLSLYKEVYLQILNVCPFDCTAVAVSGKVERL